MPPPAMASCVHFEMGVKMEKEKETSRHRRVRRARAAARFASRVASAVALLGHRGCGASAAFAGVQAHLAAPRAALVPWPLFVGKFCDAVNVGEVRDVYVEYVPLEFPLKFLNFRRVGVAEVPRLQAGGR